ncbi:hypothetical protein BDR22DRAFT_555620 [Usnea florida]
MLYQLGFVLLPLLLGSLLTTSSALTIPSLNLIAQENMTAAPMLDMSSHNTHLNETNLGIFPPVCYYISAPPMPLLSSLKCAFITDAVCQNLVSQGPSAHDKWIWWEVSGCALGYYIPTGGARPNLSQCQKTIFGEMRQRCGSSWMYNGAGINVVDLPDFGDDGSAVLEDTARFMMAPERLTL